MCEDCTRRKARTERGRIQSWAEDVQAIDPLDEEIELDAEDVKILSNSSSRRGSDESEEGRL